jgi:hypothetical protein
LRTLQAANVLIEPAVKRPIEHNDPKAAVPLFSPKWHSAKMAPMSPYGPMAPLGTMAPLGPMAPSGPLGPQIWPHGTFEGPDEPTLLMFQTHVWNSYIQEYFSLLYASAKQYSIDVVIMAVYEKETVKLKIPNNYTVLSPDITEIKSMYPNFHSRGLWACNHWLLMWLYKYYAKPKGYTRIWSFEYDVRSNGPLESLWTIHSSYDYITTKAIHKRNTNDTGYWGPVPSGYKSSWTGLKQVFRVSSEFLEYLESQFVLGHTGQDEMTLAGHAKEPIGREPFKVTSLDRYISTNWSPAPNKAVENEWLQYKILENPALKMFHPIK